MEKTAVDVSNYVRDLKTIPLARASSGSWE